ncbi:MAG: Gfo/Idh/MocA family protein [Planctomycetota bacterium]
MDAVTVLLVGCGMMGQRHVRGMGELERVAPGTLRLDAVCDLDRDLAQRAADEAEALLGRRPEVFASVEKALAARHDLEAADLVTDPRSHEALAATLAEAGLDVLCEKPLAPTVRGCLRMVEAAERGGRTLAVAENNRRSPVNRLGKAILDAGLIGEPNFALELGIHPADRIVATAWRHRRAQGGLLLDVAVHCGYILEYLLGPLARVGATVQTVQAARRGTGWDGAEVTVEVDAEDCFAATLEFASGAQGTWTAHFASPGETMFQRLIVGSEGTLGLASDRSGGSPTLRRGGETLTDDQVLDALPDYRLNAIETRLFGERPAAFSLDGPVTDRKLLAAELHDFAEAIRSGRRPESGGRQGLRAVAVVMAILESAHAGRPVAMDEIVDGSLHAYQDTIERAATA